MWDFRKFLPYSRHLRPESPQSRVSLSPRFLSLLTEGQGAQQLLGADFQWFFSPLIHFCVKLHGLFSELPGMHGHPLISHHCTEWDNRLFIHWRVSWNFYSWDDQGLHNNVGYYPLNSKQYSNIYLCSISVLLRKSAIRPIFHELNFH